ncbi:MAG TPA: histone deacetylase [Thermomicrobiaceae bacterium]|nr:histone deacetylase [Thermomicrobiaceae bacterium]
MSERFRLHDTGAHPENAQRLVTVERHLRAVGLLERRAMIEPRAATEDEVALVHDRYYVRFIEQLANAGGGYLDSDTYVSPETYQTALLAAGAAITAVDTVLDTDQRRVFAFPRPPGHHAEPANGMGFCIFNNVAVAARHAIDRRGLGRVAILDWDVHHGNGTQTIFYDSDQVLFISVHQWPLYPGTGQRDERGVGHGQGLTINIPLPPGSDDNVYLRVFDEQIAGPIAAFRPDLLIVSAGFDAHRDDPLALMEVTEAGFAAMAARVRRWADSLTNGRLAVVLEGGYNQDALARSVAATLQTLDCPADIGDQAR